MSYLTKAVHNQKKLISGRNETKIEFTLLKIRFVSKSSPTEIGGMVHGLFYLLAPLTKIIQICPDIINIILALSAFITAKASK